LVSSAVADADMATKVRSDLNPSASDTK